MTWDNFLCAAHAAARGKRDRNGTKEFFRNLQSNVARLLAESISGELCLGEFTRFVIRDPKKREICAPSFRERVLHHAVMKVCEPILDRRLIFHTYACRVGKGQQAAVVKARCLSARAPFFLKMDIRRVFDSVDHDVLKGQLGAVFRERKLVDLFCQIIDCYETAPGKGLPIGSLMSQHFANSYLSGLDRHILDMPDVLGYVRYMDDFVVWSGDSRVLRGVRDETVDFLNTQLRLRLKDVPYINRTCAGLDFLGYRVFPQRVQLCRRSRRRFAHKVRTYLEAYTVGELSELELQQRLEALCAFARFAASWHFRRRVLQPWPVEV